MTPPLPPPNGMLTTAHFHVIQDASARTSSSVTSGAIADAALGRPARQGVLHAVAGEDFEPPVVELHGNVDGDFLVRRAQDLLHAVIELEPQGGLVEAGRGGQPRILLVIDGDRRGRGRDSHRILTSGYIMTVRRWPGALRQLPVGVRSYGRLRFVRHGLRAAAIAPPRASEPNSEPQPGRREQLRPKAREEESFHTSAPYYAPCAS